MRLPPPVPAAAAFLLAVSTVAVPTLAAAESPPRPEGLVVLEERVSHRGREVVGVFGAEADPGQRGVWRVKLWQQLTDRLTISTDVVHCDPAAPMRITGDGRQLMLRELNPGGAITPYNRLDHMVWWATCHPEQAGRDPATLAPVARQLGYSGSLPEREQVLPAPPR